MICNSTLEDYLMPLDPCKLECNGMTQVISYILTHNKIKHDMMIGKVEECHTGRVVFPHCWIRLDNGATIDFRLGYWFGDGTDDDDEIPHGVFDRQDAYTYSGDLWQELPLPFFIMNSMTDYILEKVYIK